MLINDVLKIRLIITMLMFTSAMILHGQNLNKHKWKNRILIIKTSDIQSYKYQKQLKEFSNSAEDMTDRKFILYKLIGDNFELIDYKKNVLMDSGKVSESIIKNFLNKKENFEVLLIGLDGEVNLQQTEILIKDELFRVTDSMPMRRYELGNKSNN